MRALLGLASALARSRCSFMRRRNPSSVNPDPLLRSHLERQLDREAIGVMQRERLNHLPGWPDRRTWPWPPRCPESRAGGEGALECLSSALSDLRDAREAVSSWVLRSLHRSMLTGNKCGRHGWSNPSSRIERTARRATFRGAERSPCPRCPGDPRRR